MSKKNKKRKSYMFGFSVLDPYTNQKQIDLKGIKIDEAEDIFKKIYNKYL